MGGGSQETKEGRNEFFKGKSEDMIWIWKVLGSVIIAGS
jgi:hypothetical protein